MVIAIVLSPSLDAAQPADKAPEAVARSLSSLVRATVEGVVQDAVIVGTAEDDLELIADHAGCGLVLAASRREGLVRAVSTARAHVAFFLEGGFVPQTGFLEEASALLLDPLAFGGAALRRAPDRFLTRIAPALAEPVGAFVSCAALRDAAPCDLKDLIRRLKIRRTLNVRAMKVV
jgi:hypothetical protein